MQGRELNFLLKIEKNKTESGALGWGTYFHFGYGHQNCIAATLTDHIAHVWVTIQMKLFFNITVTP